MSVDEKAARRVCHECKGDRVIMVRPAGYGYSDDLAEYEPCPTCNGTGEIQEAGSRG